MTNSPNNIRTLQTKDIEVEINNEKYEIEPDLGFDISNFNQLTYSVYGFREEYPTPPTIQQLKQTMINGNDSIYNVLILHVDGNFKLYNASQIGDTINPEIVVQHEGFRPGNEYVGIKLNMIPDLDSYLHEFFRTSIYYWKKHLQTKMMHYTSDKTLAKNIDALLDLYSDLNEIKKNWA